MIQTNLFRLILIALCAGLFSISKVNAQTEEEGTVCCGGTSTIDEEPDTNHYRTGFYLQAKFSPVLTYNVFTSTTIETYNGTVDPKTMYTERMSYVPSLNLGYASRYVDLNLGFVYLFYTERFLVNNYDSTQLKNYGYSRTNTYQYLCLPLTVAYVIHLNRFRMNLGAGFLLGINLQKDGLTYDFAKKEVIDLDDNFSPVNFSMHLSLATHYELNSKLTIFAEPFYTTGVSSIWESNPIYAWKRSHVGVFLGLQYWL